MTAETPDTNKKRYLSGSIHWRTSQVFVYTLNTILQPNRLFQTLLADLLKPTALSRTILRVF